VQQEKREQGALLCGRHGQLTIVTRHLEGAEDPEFHAGAAPTLPRAPAREKHRLAAILPALCHCLPPRCRMVAASMRPASQLKGVTNMKVLRPTAALAVAALAGTLFAASSDAGQKLVHQRIAIVERVSLSAGGKSTFELTPLSPGPLEHDSGTVEPSGDFTAQVIRRGMQILLGNGVDTLVGKHGTLRVVQDFQHVDIVAGYGSDAGTWSFKSGSGSYANLKAAGRLAGVSLPGARVLVREEGVVTTG
jgi:hypothetical protein